MGQFLHRLKPAGLILLMLVMMFALLPAGAPLHAAAGKWEQFTYNGTGGSRPYFVYTPVGYTPGKALPVVMMLHGCTQTPADFAAGTGMNERADQEQFLVVYPQQTSTYNQSQCWNWFETAHQARGGGEPAIMAGIVNAVAQNTSKWTVDRKRVYIAGLSGGAAMSVIAGATYPDVFSGVGVASGLEYKAATSMTAAFTAMSSGGPNPATQGQAAYQAMGSQKRVVPTIVVHGTSDYTVYPVNGDQVVQQWMETNRLASGGTYQPNFTAPSSQVSGKVGTAQGRSYTVSRWNDNNGNLIQEYWTVSGMGHAWSGGSTNGSYTDPNGPSASQAMIDFFLDRSPQAPSAAASPASGTYDNSVQVTLSSTPSGAAIHYTTDGSTPTTASAKYTGPLTLTQTTTLRFFAIDSSGGKSPVESVTYTIRTNAPTVSALPAGSTYGGAVSVALGSDQTGTTIHYTTNGSTPTTASAVYTAPLTVSNTQTLQFIGVKNGYQSPVTTERYTITPFQLSAAPAGGTYSGAQSVSLSLNMPGQIHYTTNGATPTASSPLYTGPISVKTSQTLKFIGIDAAGNTSPVRTEAYTITAPPAVKELKLTSIASEDGYVYQTAMDGQPNSMLQYMEVGSSSMNRGQAGIVSFNTALIPSGAEIHSAHLTLYRADNTLFYYDLGPLTADIAPASGFSGSYGLSASDYSATAALLNIGNFDAVPTAQYQAITDSISQGALQYLNRSGKTQFRIHFQKATNNRWALDVMRFYTAEQNGSYVPTLTIRYQ